MTTRPAEPLLSHVSYQPAFDGLRALCITAVIAFHVGSWDRAWLNNLTNRGWVGVDVFFVLSGFLITWIVIAELERRGTFDLRRFYFRRALRLQPAYFSGLIGFTLLLYFLNRNHFFAIVGTLPYFLTYTLNFAIAFGWCAFPPYGVAWSLCIEEQFYLCWPWTLRKFGLRRCLRIALVLVTIVLVHRWLVFARMNPGHLMEPSQRSLDRVYYGFDTRIDTILMGCAAALALSEPMAQSFFQRLRDWSWFTASASMIAIVAMAWATAGSTIDGPGWHAATLGFTLIAVATALFVIALFLQARSWPARILSTRPLVEVGKISYGIYLFHDPVWRMVARLMHLRFEAVGTIPQEVIAIVAVWTISVGVAWLHYRLVETRFLALREPRKESVRPAESTLAMVNSAPAPMDVAPAPSKVA
ncbi:MAG TPA: acyltransferase [Candidatus Binataceae bacterium]|nr:acyltransferase [Candidatus Binataceae bacterium]